ncbi:MAG: branched-chain amino acid transporter periplasmic protein [Frankiales bacterium]|jgi:ABC-type branched-subunit amino acid transport system substrate-binding protein|nr:branched-chain amino acid transporter periplasmic protein [Frankiales bacterium]
MTRTRSGALVLVALALVASGCSTKSGGGKATSSGGVKTGPGVTASKIRLGVLTDTSGVFASLGATVTQGNQLGVDDINAAGGICGRQLELAIQDHGYDVQKAVSLYAQEAPNVAGMLQLLGSPMTTALLDTLKTDHMLSATATWASTLLKSNDIMISGATYDVEQINGLSYLMDQGKIKKGDKVGHIYIEGEYGANGLAGSRFAAQKLGFTITPVQIKATETDLTSAVGQLKSAGVKAIALTTTPKQTASAVGVAAVGRFAVPFLGNNPTYSPLLLGTAVGPALESNLYISGSSIPLSADNPEAQKVLAAFKKKYPGKPSNAGVTYGYGVAQIYSHVLKAACDNKDLSRQGLEAAFRTLTNVDTKGIIAPLDYSKPGQIPARQTYIVRPSKATLAIDGLKIDKQLFEAPIAKDYTPPTG